MVLTVNRILDFAQSKGSNLQIQKFAINELIQKILLGFHEQIQEINGRYELESELIEVEADPICMKQIFENLISNAIKYRSSERTFLLKVSIMDMGADILIVFEDNGIGIKPGDEEKLFDEYYRNKDIADKVEGHGIGLSTVKTLLDSHGGVIWVDPEAIVGSSFNLQLPKLQ
jgi:signal transduction histidine kinase